MIIIFQLGLLIKWLFSKVDAVVKYTLLTDNGAVGVSKLEEST